MRQSNELADELSRILSSPYNASLKVEETRLQCHVQIRTDISKEIARHSYGMPASHCVGMGHQQSMSIVSPRSGPRRVLPALAIERAGST
jgi:hypothetical protein